MAVAGPVAAVSLGVQRKVTPPPSVTLAWNQSVDPLVSSYNIYFGSAPASYTNVVGVLGITNTSAVVSNLVFGTTYYFAGTCVTTGGLESDYSPEISFTTAYQPLPPGSFKVGASYALDLRGPWLTDTNWPAIVIANPFGNMVWRLDATRVFP